MARATDTAAALSGVVKTLRISQFPVQSTTSASLADRLLGGLHDGGQKVLLFANTNFIMKCRHLLGHFDDPALILVNDGIGLSIAAKLVLGEHFDANLNGTDFTPALFRRAPRPLRVFLIGGRPEVLEKAAGHVQHALGQQVVGSADGYAGMRDTDALLDRVNAARPDVVLVAMGNPLQEDWILAHRRLLAAPLLMGVGALFDFWAGDKARAPRFVQRMRLEWLFRLSLEPRRLARRYTLDILLFLRDCYRYR